MIEDFEPEQIRAFLVNQYRGDRAAADARYRLLADVHDLLGLSGNPRMLSFISHLPDARLQEVRREHGRISAAELYRELVDFWLVGEADRQRHRGGVLSLDEHERLHACQVLAMRLWKSGAAELSLADLGAEATATLDRLAERGYTEDLAAHAVGSGTLLVRTEEGGFLQATTGQRLTTLTSHTDWVRSVAWSPDGTRLATAGAGTAHTWDVTTGHLLCTLVPLDGEGYAVLLPDGSYKLHGDPGDTLWWAIKLCRFAPGELDPFVPSIRRLPPEAPILPPPPAG